MSEKRKTPETLPFVPSRPVSTEVIRTTSSFAKPINRSAYIQWAMEDREEAVGDGFQDVPWTDECTVQLENHRRFVAERKKHAKI